MKFSQTPFNAIRQFSARDIQYQTKPESFLDFISYLPNEEGLLKAINDRKEFPVNRTVLVEAIKEQYASIGLSEKQQTNLDLLSKENTFTVITAHQPSLLTGPLYYVTKLYSVLGLAKHLNENRKDYNIVPIFINGSEDHDFEEINHLNIYGKRIAWERAASGAAGRMNLDGLSEVLQQFYAIIGEKEDALAIKAKCEQALNGAINYNHFQAKLVNAFFGNTGILFVNTDDAKLKRLFLPHLKKELIKRSSETVVGTSQAQIEKTLNFKSQAFVRPINLFYLLANARERITFEDGKYQVSNTNIVWSESEVLEEIENYPEKFSPNVVVRPLYQEVIFPNIAYVGGGGELAYWQERKAQFRAFNVFYPCLIRRNSLIFIPKSISKVLSKLDIDWIKLGLPTDDLVNQYIQSQTSGNISLEKETTQISEIFNIISKKANEVDVTLKPFVESEQSKIVKQIEQIEGRLKRAVKKNEEVNITQLKNAQQKLFPNDGLQERVDNFFQYYLQYGEEFLDFLEKHLNPLNKEVIVVADE